MAAAYGAAGLEGLVMSAGQDFPHDVFLQAGGYAEQVHGYRRPRAHGVNIAQGIRRRDLAEKVRVVHDRREKVHGLHHSEVRGHLVNQRVVRSFKAQGQPGIVISF